MTDQPPPGSRHAPRWMTVLLVVSLSLNLLVLGAVAGAMLRHDRDWDRDRTVSRDLARTPFVAAFESEDRRELGRRMMREAGPMRESGEALRDRFERLLEALRADSFDRATVESLLGEQRAAGARRLALGEAAILDQLEEMSLEERRAYADRLDRSLRRR